MEDLFKVGERLTQDNPAVDAAAFAEACFSDPTLAEILAKGGDVSEYLQSYEQMLQESLKTGGVQLNQEDAEGGITVRPEPGFVVKTCDTRSGMKVFLNVVSNEHIEAPHMKSFAELEGEQGFRVPLSVGSAVEDFDKKGEPCVTYDLVANPEVVDECLKTPAFRDTVVTICLTAVAQKYKVELDPKYKLPKIKYKGAEVQLQRIRKKKLSQIQELPADEAQKAATAARTRQEQEKQDEGGPRRPDFVVFYSSPGALPIDGFSEPWGVPPEEPGDAAETEHLYGLDLPVYRVNAFQERIRGTLKNRADQEAADREAAASGAKAEKDTRQMLAGRRCVVQVRMPDLDPHVPALKQFSAEVSDECLRLNFPLLPRSNRTAYAPLTVWWPWHFYSEQATAEWDTKADVLTVSLPTDSGSPDRPNDEL